MLVNFSISNWLSFKCESQLTMIATNNPDHRDRLANIEELKTELLPVSVIYGGNASGKSNLLSALNFAKKFIIDGTKPDTRIGVTPFLLENECSDADTSFRFELLIDDSIYEFCFSANQNKVTKESLTKIDHNSETMLFERVDSEIKFDTSTIEKEVEFLNFVARGTRANQLFLTNSISQNVDIFRPVYNWFAYTLSVISPNTADSPTHLFFDKENPYYKILDSVIPKLDVGFSSFENKNVEISEEFKIELNMDINKDVINILPNKFGDRIVVSNDGKELIAKKLMTLHNTTDGSNVMFELRQESEGTRRTIDLLPAFHNLVAEDKVVVIDEFDRSLHSILIQRLLLGYLEACKPEKRSQLIFTSHNNDILKSEFFRPDEIWIMEKAIDGSTSLKSFSDFEDIQNVKDYRDSYLLGEFGGIPYIQNGGIFESFDEKLVIRKEIG